MLKAIKKDLVTLQGKVFGTYDAQPFKKDSPTIQFIDYLIEQKIEVYPFGTRYNFEDFIFDDFKADEIEENEADNSYNWCAPVVFQYRVFNYHNQEFVAIAFHRFGDVRGNYTKYAILSCDKEVFLELLYDFEFKIPCDSWYISQRITQEEGYINAWNNETEEEYEGYYTEAPAEVKKAVENYLF